MTFCCNTFSFGDGSRWVTSLPASPHLLISPHLPTRLLAYSHSAFSAFCTMPAYVYVMPPACCCLPAMPCYIYTMLPLSCYLYHFISVPSSSCFLLLAFLCLLPFICYLLYILCLPSLCPAPGSVLSDLSLLLSPGCSCLLPPTLSISLSYLSSQPPLVLLLSLFSSLLQLPHPLLPPANTSPPTMCVLCLLISVSATHTHTPFARACTHARHTRPGGGTGVSVYVCLLCSSFYLLCLPAACQAYVHNKRLNFLWISALLQIFALLRSLPFLPCYGKKKIRRKGLDGQDSVYLIRFWCCSTYYVTWLDSSLETSAVCLLVLLLMVPLLPAFVDYLPSLPLPAVLTCRSPWVVGVLHHVLYVLPCRCSCFPAFTYRIIVPTHTWWFLHTAPRRCSQILRLVQVTPPCLPSRLHRAAGYTLWMLPYAHTHVLSLPFILRSLRLPV